MKSIQSINEEDYYLQSLTKPFKIVHSEEEYTEEEKQYEKEEFKEEDMNFDDLEVL